MRVITKDGICRLLVEYYSDEYEEESKKQIYESNIKSFVDEIYDLSKIAVAPLNENQTYIFRKRYGVLNSGFCQAQSEIIKESGLPTQYIRETLSRMFKIIHFRVSGVTENLYGVTKNNLSSPELKIEKLPIEYIDLPVKACNALKCNGISSIEQLIEISIEDLSKLYSIGDTTKESIVSKAHEYGLFFKDEEKKKNPKNKPVLLTNVEAFYNKAIENNEKRKKELNDKYEQLSNERTQLLSRLEKVDDEIYKTLSLLGVIRCDNIEAKINRKK